MHAHDALRLYLSSRIAANRRGSTIEQYRQVISAFITWAGVSKLQDLTALAVRNYLVAMRANWQAVTAAGVRDVICTFLAWCGEEGLIRQENWKRRVPKVVVDRGSPKRLSQEQVGRLLVAVEVFANPRDAAIIHLLLDTGLRSGELSRVQLTDLDFADRSVRVDCACKGRKERHVWFSPDSARKIKAYLRSRRKGSPYLFITRSNRPIGGSYLLHMVKHLGRDAGIQGLTVHRLRHTALTMLAEAGMSPILLQKFAGHASISTTMIYARPDDRAVQLEYERVWPATRLRP
jgi:site-specific recombinase XerD